MPKDYSETLKTKTLGIEEEISKFIKSINYDEGRMKIENKKGGYVAAVVKPPQKDLGRRLKLLLNKHAYEVAIGVGKNIK